MNESMRLSAPKSSSNLGQKLIFGVIALVIVSSFLIWMSSIDEIPAVTMTNAEIKVSGRSLPKTWKNGTHWQKTAKTGNLSLTISIIMNENGCMTKGDGTIGAALSSRQQNYLGGCGKESVEKWGEDNKNWLEQWGLQDLFEAILSSL